MIIEDSLDSSLDGWGLWIGTQDGLWHYDARSKAFTRFGLNLHDPASLSSNFITSLFRDSDGVLWIGTDRGLNKMNAGGRGFTCFNESNGLPDHHVLGILEDGQGRLWVSTRDMLSRFDPRMHRFDNYAVGEVVKDLQFGAGCCLRTSTGDMYFGGQGGFIVFHPDSMTGTPRIPPIAFTGLRKFEKLASLDSAISEKTSIEFSHTDNVFTLEFAALDFVRPEANRYAYILEGHDTSWNYVGSRPYARYVNVDPGTYTFRVKGSNSDGVWNEAGASLAVVIRPPWWKTTWFSVLLWSAVAGSVGGSIRQIERRKLTKRIAELEKERAVERERARISQDMHDEVGSSLSEIAILSQLAKRKPEEAEEHVDEISERTAELIDNVSEIVWAMNPKNDTLDNFVGHVRRYGVKYLANAGINCQFTAPQLVPSRPLLAEVRRNLFLVVKEALHNIVKHSGASAVMMRLLLAEKGMEIQIEDNGRGFTAGTGRDGGNGLGNMKKRIADIGGTFTIESQPGCGTKVGVRVRA